jgi:hypothetical protein
MHLLRLLILLLSLLLLLIACQPRTLTKDETYVKIDSTLYFEVVNINDPFMDTLAAHTSQHLTLKKKILPPPIPTIKSPDFKEVEGFRVQIFAGLDSINGLSILAQANEIAKDSVHFFKEKGLFKVQVGDYQFRPQADSSKNVYSLNGFSGTWIVRRSIIIPVLDEEENNLKSKTQDEISAQEGRFKIQVVATSSEEKAKSTVQNLKTETYNAFYEKSGNIFKVYVGFFNIEQRARQVLEQMRQSGYSDAWLVY